MLSKCHNCMIQLTIAEAYIQLCTRFTSIFIPIFDEAVTNIVYKNANVMEKLQGMAVA